MHRMQSSKPAANPAQNYWNGLIFYTSTLHWLLHCSTPDHASVEVLATKPTMYSGLSSTIIIFAPFQQIDLETEFRQQVQNTAQAMASVFSYSSGGSIVHNFLQFCFGGGPFIPRPLKALWRLQDVWVSPKIWRHR